jgi:hypothetical protein
MVSWDKTQGIKSQGSGERKEIQRITLQNGDNKIRLVGEVMPRYVYWLTTKDGKRMPVECLKFDRNTEQFSGTEDPFDEISQDIYADKPQFAYVCNVIDRNDNQVKLFDLKATIYRQIVDFAKDSEYGNPADDTSGYDITIVKEKTGPLPQNVKYTVRPARASTALTDSEKEAELFELDRIYKRPDYTEQKRWLLENTTLFAGDDDNSFSPESVEDLD